MAGLRASMLRDAEGAGADEEEDQEKDVENLEAVMRTLLAVKGACTSSLLCS